MADANIKIVLSNGKEAGKTINQLTAEAIKLSREIKKTEEGSKEFTQATEDWKKVQARLVDMKKSAFNLEKGHKDLNEEIADTTKAQGLLNSEFLDMLPFSSQIQQFAGSFRKLNTGVKATTLSTHLFKTALAATGIGLIIIALGTLFTWLSKTQQGMDFVAKAGDAMRAVFQVVIDRVLAFGGAMKDLLSGNFGAAAEGLKNTFSGIGAEIANDTKEAWNLSGALQNITREEKQLDLQRAKSRATIEQLKLVAEDQTKSTEERAAAASKALNMEQDLMQKSIDLQERKVKAIKAQNDLGTSTDEDINRAIDAEIELANLREESTTKQIELNNKLNELNKTNPISGNESIKKQQEEEQKAYDEKIKAQEEYAKMILEADKTLQDKRIALITDEQDRKIAEIQIAADREIEAFEGTDAQKTEFLILKQQERDAAIDAVIEENNLKAREKNLTRLKEENQLKEEIIYQNFYEGLISEEDREEQLYQLQKTAIEKRLALLVASKETETLEYQKLYSQLAQLHSDYEAEKTASTKKEEDARRDLQMAGLQAASGIFAGFADLLAQDEVARKKNWKMIKALKTAELLSNLPVEISNIWKRAADLGPIAGPIVGAIQTGLAGVRFIQARTQLESVKYAKGGPVYGPSHDAGGIPFSVSGRGGYEMEGDEIILTKGVYRDPVLRSIASDLNAMGGGRRFAMGGPVVDRGFAPTTSNQVTAVSNNQAQNTPSVSPVDMSRSEGLLEEIARNTKKSAENPPTISLQKVREGLNTLNDVEEEARF
jgi:hypothetical protein